MDLFDTALRDQADLQQLYEAPSEVAANETIDRLLAIPAATGNRRLDSFRNVLQTGRAGLLLLLPGRVQTLRINGRACVSTDAEQRMIDPVTVNLP